MITSPIGEKKRGRPKATRTRRDMTRQVAELMNVSVRSIERAARVNRLGIPELGEMVLRGELKLGPAEFLAQFPHDMQRGVIAFGAAHVRRWVALNRRAYADEDTA